MKSIGESILRTGIFVVIIGGQSNKALSGAALGTLKNGVKHTGLALTRCYCWIFVGFVLVAQTGIDYRKLKKGIITKREFYRNARTRTVMSLIGLATGAAGASVGFAVGTIIFPGLGSAVGAIIGTMLGGIGGSTVGRSVSAKAYGIIEDRMEANAIENDLKRDFKEEKQQKIEFEKAIEKAQIEEEVAAYEEALAQFGATEHTTLDDLKQLYKDKVEYIEWGRNRSSFVRDRASVHEDDDDPEQVYIDLLTETNVAYETIKQVLARKEGGYIESVMSSKSTAAMTQSTS
mmetsp:Transcript_15602/g.21084  ORF Transcript_15602/g.21084 Transcript_15602/m.21084 type:complete len:290 (-) Transcript_15602:129-998(-)|eukprot:CAMPEP_0176371826 /NCGR_PEP_ID=MMETSP0126-20121128/24971_1 /TAXON_ID=141414 ORGANISM="Strombidinopsis acuminatum, Strain SPMC142" /NCGR_SAMPLE_ID=MMETSP0126 /ASSEMBLY_ACC=CAM_ASM_000229 /LENGTH=289 /DNA_ID=CAMNT_0017731441 /DNA_START=693 /DNA_END=1562 /DNA_ORIENTATION=+